MDAPQRIPDAELSARQAQVHPLLVCGEPCLTALGELLEPGPYCLLFVDWDGVVLWCRSRGMPEEMPTLSPGCDCAALVGTAGVRPACFKRGEAFHCESATLVHQGEPVADLGALVLCQPKPGQEAAAMLRLAARSLVGLSAQPSVSHGPLAGTERDQLWHAEIIKHVPAALAVADAKTGRVVMANKRVEELLGIRLTSLRALNAPDSAPFVVRHPDGRLVEEAQSPAARVLKSGQGVSDEELVITLPTGREITVLLSIVPLIEGDRTVALVMTLQDVTAIREAERERERILAAERQARERAEASSTVRERMLAVLGHDLRQPLSAVLLALDALEAEEALAGHVGILRKTRRSATRIEAMIRDLVDFGCSAAGGLLRIEPQDADLRGIADAVIEELQVVEPSLEVRLETAGDLRGCWDEGRLEQALTNMLTNAVRYGESGAPVQVRLAGANGEMTIEVHNRGEPIPADIQQKLFQPFVRATRKGPGLGLGLYILREIARAHGGSVTLRSAAGEGTVFTLRLPRRCPAGG